MILSYDANPVRMEFSERTTISWCRGVAFSASSRLFDLNGAAKTDQMKQASATMIEARRFPSLINADRFSVHTGNRLLC
jgi:hypothetical protein